MCAQSRQSQAQSQAKECGFSSRFGYVVRDNEQVFRQAIVIIIYPAMSHLFLFNLAIRSLPSKLNLIPGLRHTLYTDDITLWTAMASDSQIEGTLQRDMVIKHVTDTGLECSHSKSELLVL
ncbi:hypothetical protein HPB50_022107 [Hyalomma asiaticum]|uniref:Uncharacterized protein n=1 Tax=Hyalomma asiaticum TaxID=266040 RepID=A0ACB7TP83_HYAAI|nr:hypothetical protein HPB50_022107 [Hyalomma asiaticum]